jgi:hypothetical protein
VAAPFASFATHMSVVPSQYWPDAQSPSSEQPPTGWHRLEAVPQTPDRQTALLVHVCVRSR